MKNLILLLLLNSALLNLHCNAQTLSNQIIASAGSFQSNSIGSLSFTVGETNIHTYSTVTNILSEGFHQPFLITGTNFNLKLFIEGYYLGSGLMQPVLYNTGLSLDDSDCDSLIVELHDQINYSTLHSTTILLKTNGLAAVHYPSSVSGGTYFIAVRGRNMVETWSKTPITFNGSAIYFDFTTP